MSGTLSVTRTASGIAENVGEWFVKLLRMIAGATSLINDTTQVSDATRNGRARLGAWMPMVYGISAVFLGKVITVIYPSDIGLYIGVSVGVGWWLMCLVLNGLLMHSLDTRKNQGVLAAVAALLLVLAIEIPLAGITSITVGQDFFAHEIKAKIELDYQKKLEALRQPLEIARTVHAREKLAVQNVATDAITAVDAGLEQKLSVLRQKADGLRSDFLKLGETTSEEVTGRVASAPTVGPVSLEQKRAQTTGRPGVGDAAIQRRAQLAAAKDAWDHAEILHTKESQAAGVVRLERVVQIEAERDAKVEILNATLAAAVERYNAMRAELASVPRDGWGDKYRAFTAVADENDLMKLILFVCAGLAVSPIVIKVFLSNGSDYILALQNESDEKERPSRERREQQREAARLANMAYHDRVDADLRKLRDDYDAAELLDNTRLATARADGADAASIARLQKALAEQRADLLVYPQSRPWLRWRRA